MMTTRHWLAQISWTILLAAAALMVSGWLGIARAEQIAESSGRMLRQQIVWSILAVAILLLVSAVNYRRLSRSSYLLLVGSVSTLVVVFWFPAVNGSHRWIRLGPVGFQPSEFAKLAVVLALARYLSYRENYRRLSGLLAPLALVMVPVVLILREPDLGTSLVFVPVLLAMLLAAGARLPHLATVLLVAVAAAPLLWTQMSREQKSRVTALWEDTSPGARVGDDAFHLYQSKQMIASGGLWGLALDHDRDADPALVDNYVPAAATDSIFSILVGRYGLIAAGVVLGLYLLIIWRGLAIAAATYDPFGRLVAVGVVALLGIQVVINTAMLVGLLPITGLSLPLVSYGGSGLVAQALGLGLLSSIAARPGDRLAGEPFRFVERTARRAA